MIFSLKYIKNLQQDERLAAAVQMVSIPSREIVSINKTRSIQKLLHCQQ